MPEVEAQGTGDRGRVGRRMGPILAALALVAPVLAGCGVDGSLGSAAGPGRRLDGAGLPRPASNLVELGSLVAYYAIDDAELQLVAVDPERAEVAWTMPALVSEQARGVAITLDRVPGGVAILAPRADGIDSFRLQVVGADGEVRWDRPVSHPQSMPSRCGDRVCIETGRGPVGFDPRRGSRTDGARLPDGAQVVAGAHDQVLAVTPQDDARLPARTVQARPRFEDRGGWERPVSALYGDAEVTSYAGWHGRRDGDTWTLWLGGASDLATDEVPDFPYVSPAGSVAGFAVDDGAPRWDRDGFRVCGEVSSEDVLVLCEATLTYASETERGTSVVSALERVDPATGQTTFTVELEEPLDLFDLDGRLLALGRDRWLLRDGDEVSRVDLRAGHREPAAADVVGWCADTDETVPLRGPWSDEPATFAGPTYLHPCTLDAGARAAELVAPIVDGRLAPDGWSAVTAGTWVLWVEDGRLAGVEAEG